MKVQDKKLNKPLILFSLAFAALLAIGGDPHLLPLDPIKSVTEFTGLYAGVLILLPIINFWFRALWNNIVPTVFHTGEISYWESLGLLTLLSLLRSAI